MIKKHRRIYQFSAILLLLIIIMVAGFMILEKLSLYESLWMTVISVLTVGYGDIVPKTNMGKAFSMLLIPITMGFTTYMLTYVASSMIEGRLTQKWVRKKMEKQIEKMNGHYIICGFDRIGQQVCQEFYKHKDSIVIIIEEETYKDQVPEGVPFIIGDAKRNEILQKAGVERAKGLVATSSDDAANVFITLSAKGIHTDIEVIARAEEDETVDKLRRAGADQVVNPSDLGGRRMALSLLKPVSMNYIDSVIHANSYRFQMEEYRVGQNSPLADKRIGDLDIEGKYRIKLLGFQRNQEFISNPDKEDFVRENDTLIMFGDRKNIEEFLQEIK